jgi:hypothetical protein
MKKTSLSLAVIVVLLSSLVPRIAAESGLLGRANIPFSFTAGGQHLSAGNYEIWHFAMDSVILKNGTTAEAVTLHVPGDIANSNAMRLIFHNYGSASFLAAVAGPTEQMVLPESRHEKELAALNAGAKTVALEVEQ